MKPLLDRPLASFPYDPRKTWSFMFMLGVLVLLGLLRIVQNGVAGEWGIIFMLIVIPGLAMIMVGSELRLKGPILIIAEDGLVDRRKGPDGVRWEDVQEATIKRRILSRGIRIELTNGERYDIETNLLKAQPLEVMKLIQKAALDATSGETTSGETGGDETAHRSG